MNSNAEYDQRREAKLVIANPCPRCIGGSMLTRYGETSCFQCGHEIVPDYQLETTKAWLSARNDG